MNVLITGISKGLGLKTSEVLLKNGWIVYGISRSRTKELNDLLLQYPNQLKWLQYDMNNTSHIGKIIFKEFSHQCCLQNIS
jgi:3-oxoacyl-[acyl-carrier protein] reductase